MDDNKTRTEEVETDDTKTEASYDTFASINSWETYKILNKIKGCVQQKRKVAQDVAAQQSIDAHGKQITIEKRINTTKEQLNDLLCDGKELISNIKLANERREARRRLQDDEQRAQLLADLEQESEEATNKLNVINSRWIELGDVSDPMDLNERLHHQSDRIENLMQQKDGIIFQLQDALNKGDRTYNMDQVKQQGDIQCLIARIDEQIEVMKSVYLEHLELLHQSIDCERRTFKLYHSNAWQHLYDERSADGEKFLHNLLDRNEMNYEEIMSTRLQHEEINRKMRIQLDRDNDLVQQKLQRVKAEVDLKTDQLSYNYYVPQKRAAENIVVRNKQKNRLIKMRTCISFLRKQINEAKVAQSIDIERQTHYVLSLYANIKELEHKMGAFSETDDKKFQHIWELHEMNANSKLKHIMMIDRILHEKHLGLMWQAFVNKPLQRNPLNSIQAAIDATRSQSHDDLNATRTIKKHMDDINADQNTFSHLFYSITEQIASQQNWILNDNLTEILDLVCDEEHKRIVTIDNIFSALGINSMQNASLLKEYFLPYASCVSCSTKYSEHCESADTTHVVAANNSEKCTENHCEFRKFSIEEHMIPVIVQQFLIELGIKSIPLDDKHNSIETIEDGAIDFNGIEQFWKDFVSVLPSDLEIIWDTIDSGLVRYLHILKRKQKLTNECTFLRQQNAEIMHLLQQYANGSVNS